MLYSSAAKVDTTWHWSKMRWHTRNETAGAAHGAVRFLTDMGLFRGQSASFITTLNGLAAAADAAHRGM